MEQLWAPWRAEYFLIEKPLGCIFCSASSQTDREGEATSDQKNHVLVRDRTCFALLNAYPYSGGHIMISPYRHTGELEDLTDDEMKDLMVLTRRCKSALTKAFKPDAFNLGMNLGLQAGAGIPGHLHMHIVPRWNGDTNFMPVIAGTRVLAEGLNQTYEKLIPCF